MEKLKSSNKEFIYHPSDKLHYKNIARSYLEIFTMVNSNYLK